MYEVEHLTQRLSHWSQTIGNGGKNVSMEQNENTVDILDMGDDMSTERAKDTKKTVKKLFQLLLKQKWRLMTVLLFAITSVGLTLYTPQVISRGIDLIFEGVMEGLHSGTNSFNIDFRQLGEIVLLLLGIYIASSLLTYIQYFMMSKVAQNFVLSLRKDLSQKLTDVPLRFYDTNKKGEILSRVSNDLERVNQVLQEGLLGLMTSILTIIGAIVLMIRMNWVLSTISMVSIFLGLVITAVIGAKSHERFTNRQKSLGKFNGQIEEYFSGQTVMKVFNLEDEMKENVDHSIDELYRDDRKAQFIMFVIMPIIRFVNQIGYVVIAGVGATFVIQGRLSIGQIQAFFQYVNQASEPLAEATFTINNLQSAIASAERVFEVLDEVEEQQDSQHAKRIPSPKGNITFENVKFGYGEKLLMDGVNFQIKAGQKVAIVGPTGAGKTTLINLLMRFYELNDGSIKIDGVDTKDLTRSYLRSLFGMVLQDSWLFDGTVADNIGYSREKVTKSEIVHAARLARADYFIRTLPNGYDSVMNDENTSISQGQKQLLCIARAMLANPQMLLLDEATSSVDTRTELEIQKAMDHLMEGRTSFIIAHRLSTIRNADMILVMDKGNIVEQGSHDELLQKNGMYSDIYNSQFVKQEAS